MLVFVDCIQLLSFSVNVYIKHYSLGGYLLDFFGFLSCFFFLFFFLLVTRVDLPVISISVVPEGHQLTGSLIWRLVFSAHHYW